MYRTLLLFTLVGLSLLGSSKGFDSGLSGRERTTHFGLTECALLRITASYLKSVHNSTRLNNLANSTALCEDVETMFNQIQQECHRLGINSALRSVIDLVCTSNILVNLEEFTSPSSHFDNEAFAEGSRLIANRLADARTKLLSDSLSITDARISFGQAMHTLQDFYAHSNWVELGPRVPNQFIGTNIRLGIYAPQHLKTCSNCTEPRCAERNILSEIKSGQYLTSGYFDVFSSISSKPNGKCSHGGPLDMTTRTDAVGFGINKDNENSDHGSLHVTAAEIALTATIQQLQSLWSAVANKTFGRFLGFHSSSLVIAIDTTGSMSPVIELVKQVAISIIESTRGENALLRPSNYIFSPFNDPEWGPLTITTDAQFVIDKIANLTVNGGGDAPELYYHGLDNALSVCEANSVVYTFTDAPAKDAFLRPKVLARATELKARIYSFYVRSTRLSGKRRRRRDVGGILDGSNADDLATATGGSTIGLNPYQDTNATTAFIIRHLSPQQSLLTIFGSYTTNTTFAVDANINRIQIDLMSSGVLNGPTSDSFRLVDPNDKSITPTLVASSAYFRLYTIENPTPGLWKLFSSQSHPHTIDIIIPETSNMPAVTTCSTTLSQQIIRESNNAYGPLLTAPIVNQSNLVLVTSCNNLPSSIQLATIELVNKLGETVSILETMNVTKTGSIILPVIIPDTDFRILTKIKLIDGSIVQRQSNILISPTSILISITNQPYTLTNNSMTSMTFTIYNRAEETLSIRMCVLDTLQLLGINRTCRQYTVANMSSIDDTLNIIIDASSEENNITYVNNMTSGSMTFDITAINSIGKELKNYNKIPFYIQTGEYNDTSSPEAINTTTLLNTTMPLNTTVPTNTSVTMNTTVPTNTTVTMNTTTPLNTTVSMNTTMPLNTTVTMNTTMPLNTTVSMNTTTPLNITVPMSTTVPMNTTMPLNTTVPMNTTTPLNITVPLNTTVPMNTTTPLNITVPMSTTVPMNTTTPLNTTVPMNTTVPTNTTVTMNTTTPLNTTVLINTTMPLNTTVTMNTTTPLNTTVLINTTMPLNTTVTMNTTMPMNTTVSMNTTTPLNITVPMNTTVPTNTTMPPNTTVSMNTTSFSATIASSSKAIFFFGTYSHSYGSYFIFLCSLILSYYHLY